MFTRRSRISRLFTRISVIRYAASISVPRTRIFRPSSSEDIACRRPNISGPGLPVVDSSRRRSFRFMVCSIGF